MSNFSFDSPVFYSDRDEAAFFGWLKSIPAVKNVSGRSSTLDVTLKSTSLDEESLRELIALLFRHRADMTCLQGFLTDENRRWFRDNPAAFWHDAVFGTRANRKVAARKISAAAARTGT